MKKVFILSVILLVILDITGQIRIKKDECSASKTFIFPSQSSDGKIKWVFKGGQCIWMFYRNENILGVTLTVECLNFLEKDPQRTCSYIILPMFEADGGKYCIFGYTPIGWGFTLSTISDAAFITAIARWDPFEPDD